MSDKRDMSTTYYHGSYTTTTEIHTGLCLTDSIESAGTYGPIITTITIDGDLTTLECSDLIDRDEQIWPGDDGDNLGHDILTYSDEDQNGRPHDTIRLMTVQALTSATIGSIIELDSDEYYDLVD